MGEYEVYSDSEGEAKEKEKEEEEKEEKKEKREALQPKHDPAPGEASKQEEQEEEEEEEDWSEWGKSIATEAELNQLLSLCTGNEVIDFNEHIQSELKSSTLSKLGEASYSEVFLQTPHTKSSPPPARTVLKIIPFGYPTQCPLKQIYDELLITVSMAPIPGFIGFHSAHIVRGPFPQPLLDLWDHWDQHVKAGGSENDRPDFYNEGQLFAVIGLEDGGRDLEAWSFKGEVDGEGGWREAREVFWRVAGALARGEEEREFEHRDLHFGNIVIKRVPIEVGESEDEMLRNLSLDDEGGVIARTQLQVSLIDYTLSRARGAYGLLSFTPLDDEALFEGKGDYQFDIYRFMRSHLQTLTPNPPLNPLTGLPELDWSQPTPATNLYWLHYLLHILLHKKKELRKPPAQSTSSRSRSKGPSGGGGGGIAGFAEEDVLAFRELEGLYKVLDCRPRGSKRGAPVEESGWGGFGEGASGFVRWAVGEGVVGYGEL
ncbi:hypothetical protein L211DRAFT_827099 [Terfezia boudieri ATCC MYA-4762]|uniref:non-specific serine/threonine protein kinase n=1 Tax=Terfezia boudieri ATCC MYA-4762 TaxID=1051890 RepID=A0A3N4LLP0_9PEZI|nr:hypothetical protein L211DRAFT_827099 [Terfezia boudieri ATCC MYA-4762]